MQILCIRASPIVNAPETAYERDFKTELSQYNSTNANSVTTVTWIERSVAGAASKVQERCFDIALIFTDDSDPTVIPQMYNGLCQALRHADQCTFTCIFTTHPAVSNSGLTRTSLFNDGKINMLTSSLPAIFHVVRQITYVSQWKNNPSVVSDHLVSCPYCHTPNLSPDGLWTHVPLYHISAPNNTSTITCPLCHECFNGSTRRPFQVHLRNCHGPVGRGEISRSELTQRAPSLYCFALVVCQHPVSKKFLLVQEFANVGYWLPGGRVDSDESPKAAAVRETLEEAGVDVTLTGLIKVEYSPKVSSQQSHYVRLRFIFSATVNNVDQEPKTVPDYESAGAIWATLEEVSSLPLRGPEPKIYFPQVAQGVPVLPIESVS